MKTLLLSLLAAGTAYYFTSRVFITGPSDWGAVLPGFHENEYGVSASASPLVRVTVGGDPEFSIDDSACPGVRSCVATVAFMANVGGDYSGTITVTSASSG